MDQKYQESFEMWCWRRWEKINWTNHVRNEEVLQGVKEDKNILQTIKERKANWKGLLKNDIMNIYKRVVVQLHVFLTFALHGDE